MKKTWVQWLGSGLLIVVLAGCSGSGAGVSPPDDGIDDGGDDGGSVDPPPPVSPFTPPSEAQALYYVIDFPDDFAGVKDNYNVGPATLYADLPRPMAVTYDGFMEITIASTPNANIQSDATLTVDMQSGAISGGASDFIGWAYNAETDSNDLALYEGDITFSGGSLVAGLTGDTRLEMQVDGALDNGLQDFTLTGTLDGRLYGAAADGLYAGGSYYGIGRDITLTADGVDVYGSANIWALKQ